jgi:hypothetical protein
MSSDLPMKIMCVNDKNRPQEIPIEKWLESGKVYTLIAVQHLLSSGSIGFELDEITLDEACFPYHYFNPERFVPIDEGELEAVMNELDEILNPYLA